MKTRNIIILSLSALLAVSCHDNGNWDETSLQTGMEAYGNQNLIASNPKTIAEVKTMFSKATGSGEPELVTEHIQIQGIVIGNDEGGNIYNQLYIRDASGAICVSIKQGGLYGAYPIGQCIMIELNGLYLGNYGGQPQIGTRNVSQKTGAVQLNGMSRYEWQTHHKIIGPIAGINANPIEITGPSDLTLAKDCNQLVTLKGAELTEANGKKAFANKEDAPTNQFAVNRSIKGTTKMVVRTSTSCKFAMEIMPMGKVDITGVASYYNGTWQLMMRTKNDFKSSNN